MGSSSMCKERYVLHATFAHNRTANTGQYSTVQYSRYNSQEEWDVKSLNKNIISEELLQ